jgi:hypothetical protein
MNIPELRQSLKIQWLNYYQKNRSWLVQMRIWCTCDGERRPLSSFILATLSVLEPKLEQLFPFILELSNNPDKIISALGLNFNPEQQLHLLNDRDCTDKRSLWENLVYDSQPASAYTSQYVMAGEQLMTMLADDSVFDSTVASSVAVETKNQPLPNFATTDTPQIYPQSAPRRVNHSHNQVKSPTEDLAASTTIPTKIPSSVATISQYPLAPRPDLSVKDIIMSVPLYTLVLDEITGVFDRIVPTLRDVQQPATEESPAYTLGETICVPSTATNSQVTEPPKSEVHQQEDVSTPKKKYFNLASWIDDFCQGSGWEWE